MFRSLKRARFEPIAVVALAATMAAAWAMPALAAPIPVGTPACRTQPQCVAVGLYGSTTDPYVQALTITAGKGSRGSVPVVVYPDSVTDPGQDWTLISDGLVSNYAVAGGYGLTAFDFANYASDELISLEFSPAGIPTGYCAASVGEKMVLRTCNGSVFQTFMVRGAMPTGLVRYSQMGGYLAGLLLSAVQEKNIYHHNAVTGSLRYDTQVFFFRPLATDTQVWAIGLSA